MKTLPSRLRTMFIILTLFLSLVGCTSVSDQPPSTEEEKGATPSTQTQTDTVEPNQAATKEGAPGPEETEQNDKLATKAQVIEVIDGDTLKVRHLQGLQLPSSTIRLIGVDTPEVHGQVEPFGPKASRYTKQRLNGTTIWLTKDVSETDRYGRALRYVWIRTPPSDPTDDQVREGMFNAQLVEQGYAQASSYPPDVKYQQVLQRLQKEARENNRGLWGLQESSNGQHGKEIPTDSTLRYDPKGPDRDCGDFSTRQQAQAFFEAAGGPSQDPHRLDGDGDGLACENLP